MPSAKSKRQRHHSMQFTQEVLTTCAQPGASVAGVALARGLSANLVRQWAARSRVQSGWPQSDGSYVSAPIQN